MISWIQRYFQKHFKWLFLLLLAITIVSFVFITNASSGFGTAGPRRLSQPYFGYDLGRDEDQRRIFGDANYSVVLKAGYQALQGPQLQEYALQRIASLALADQLHLPQPTQAQVSEFVTGLPVFQNEQGQFDQTRYQRFGDSLKGNPQFTTADAARVLRDDTRINQLQKLLGGPGYVLPREIRDQLVRADSTWSIQVASLDYAGFDPNLTVTDDALARFFEENSFRYQVPERYRLSMVEFKAADFTPTGTPTEEQLRNYYNANPARFPVPPEAGKTDAPSLTPAAGADDFTKVRPQVEAALREEVALSAASRAANDLTVALYEAKVPANSPQLASALSARGKDATALPPFSPDAPPSGLEWTASHYDQISRLGAERHFTDALRTPTGFAVLLWNETLPSYQPLLPEVRERVAADYRESEKRKRFVEHGRTLKARLAEAVKSGTAFEKAAADARLTVQAHTGFTFRQPPQGLPFTLLTALESLETGGITDMVSTSDKGFLAFVQEKKLPELNESNPQYAEVRQQLARFSAGATTNSIIDEMVEAELRKSAPADADPAS